MMNLKIIDFNRNGRSPSSYSVAWDGTDTPDITKIPEGVVVSYNSQSYTGTLEATSETLDKIYLVGAENSTTYARYVTNINNNTYEWISIGSTDINLSGYITCEEYIP